MPDGTPRAAARQPLAGVDRARPRLHLVPSTADAATHLRGPSLARPVSGLRREFGLWDTFVFNTLGYALGLVLAMTPFFAGSVFPGRNVLVVLTIGTVLTVFNGLVYGSLAGAMPRSGGEYVYNSRVLHPAVGFVTNWGLTWSQLLGLAIYTQWCVTHAVSVALGTMAYALDRPDLLGLAAWVERPWATFAVATALLGSVVAAQAAGMRFLRRLLNSFFILAMAGFVTILVLLVTNDHASFARAVDDFFWRTQGTPGGYQAVIDAARASGWGTQSASWTGYLIALPLAYWMFIGFTYSVYIGGEVRDPDRTQRWAILGSLAVGYVLYMAVLGAYYHTVGSTFNDAAAYLESSGRSPLPVSGVVNFFAGLLTRNVVLTLLIGAGFFLWHYLLLFVMFAVVVRNIFAWGLDEVLPRAVTRVGRRTRTPWVATMVAGATVLGLLALFCFTTLFTEVFNYIVLFSIAFWVTSFAAMLLPYRRPDLAASGHPLLARRVLGVPVLTIGGLVNLVLFSLILYASFTLPAFSGPTGLRATVFVAAIYLSAVALYLVVRAYRRHHRRDLAPLLRYLSRE